MLTSKLCGVYLKSVDLRGSTATTPKLSRECVSTPNVNKHHSSATTLLVKSAKVNLTYPASKLFSMESLLSSKKEQKSKKISSWVSTKLRTHLSTNSKTRGFLSHKNTTSEASRINTCRSLRKHTIKNSLSSSRGRRRKNFGKDYRCKEKVKMIFPQPSLTHTRKP